MHGLLQLLVPLLLLVLVVLVAWVPEAAAKEDKPLYDRHLKHIGKHPQDRVMNRTVPDMCPELTRPHNIHFMVLNMDRAFMRLAKMKRQFAKLGLPDFERIPGVEVKVGGVYDIPQRSKPFLSTMSSSLTSC